MPTQPTPIALLPDAPSRNDSPSTFIADADAYVAALNQFTGETNNLADNAFDNAVEAASSASSAQTLANEAATSAASAAVSAAQAAGAANFVGEWSSLTGALNTPATVVHNDVFYMLLSNLADVTASEPTVGNSDWTLVRFNVVRPKTAGATLDASFSNELQDGSAFVMPLAADVPANWYIEIELPRKFSANKPTITASGSDTFSDEKGTDTVIEFSTHGIIRLTSDGVNDWRL